MGKIARGNKKNTNRVVIWFILPTIFFELLIHVIPMLIGVYISFTHLTSLTLLHWLRAPFIGFGNYQTGLSPTSPIGATFYSSLLVSLSYSILTVLASAIIGVGGALLVNPPFRGRAIFRALFLIPYAVPAIVVGIIWRFIFSRQFGLANGLLVNIFHILGQRPFWLIGPHAFVAMLVANVWKTWPFIFLVSLAGLQTISQDYLEAAEIDGAGAWRQFSAIVLPGIRPVLSIGVLLSFLWTFNDFTIPYSMMGSSPPTSANVLPLSVYSNAFQNWNFGTGAAMSVLMILILGLIAVLFDRLFKVGRSA
ncbi:carbohydrate ABC transporter permease [Alicyclobacillus sp. SO9]|uniref:carbohydrate ABC transporter permease n=1 Tax=Alicyclobacillus sp. SO9 TaxID=2665646 RepID=UPI0018E7BD3C|nr:sugar ABC transporter permease [Alicyclobacillus sp. SO9]QQE80520.1 sugar ABC transporter permease [Alicyclobacillus sp. SO9]